MNLKSQSQAILAQASSGFKHAYDPACVCRDCFNFERNLHFTVKEQKKLEQTLTASVCCIKL